MGHDHGHAAGRAEDRGRLRLVLAVTATVLVVELVGGVGGRVARAAGRRRAHGDRRGRDRAGARGVVRRDAARGVRARRSATTGPRSWPRCSTRWSCSGCAATCCTPASAGSSPETVHAGPMIAFAAVGLVANGTSMTVLSRSETGSMNLRGAATEVLARPARVRTGAGGRCRHLVTDWDRADPIASLLIAVLILPRSLLAAEATRPWCCSSSRPRGWTSRRYAATSSRCPVSSTSTTCTRGRSPAACRASPRT